MSELYRKLKWQDQFGNGLEKHRAASMELARRRNASMQKRTLHWHLAGSKQLTVNMLQLHARNQSCERTRTVGWKLQKTADLVVLVAAARVRSS